MSGLSLKIPLGPMKPADVRRFLEQLGPLYVKIGQYLALRPDLVPQEYSDELLKLVDRATPFPWEEARATLEEDLGRDPAEVFSYLDRAPLAAGSLAQVHLGRLPDGTDVAVKVRRPGIEERIRRDLQQVRLMARLLAALRITTIAEPRAVVQELTDWLMQETDFRNERRNLGRLYQLEADNPGVVVPRPYPQYSTRRVVTAAYLRGIPFSELLLAVRSGEESERRRVDRLGIDLDRLAENLVRSSLRQMFRYQFFHADLHPGNLLVLANDAIGFVDFGLCDELDDTVRESQFRYLSAAYSGDAERIFKALTQILVPTDETDLQAFRRDFLGETRELGFTQDYWRDGGSRPSPVARYLVAVMRSARRNQLQVPARILSMYRTLLTVETVANQLGTPDGLRRVGRDFFARLQIEETFAKLEPENLKPVLLSTLNLLREGPEQLGQILADLAQGTYSLQVTATEASRSERMRNRRARLLALGLVSIGVALLLTMPAPPKIFGLSLAWPLAILLLALYGWIFLLIRNLK